ncbi:putative cupin superfamily protein [Nocardiopsis mwathae]|uniref:Putative cupin superfamily protein n=1 Tax=Nocardiopsis mwathae TaxID=1472723 RepID=A0A7W9YGZ7_9ACTN|nr:nuclear transport factor 2 family protein [Nocardiopsis mwathae]MBB6171967.1 putative cupin superfamily protein [Nocardiopsis mwathae]
MAVKEEAGQRFDVDGLRHALEDKDLDAMMSLFTEDAEYRIISQSSPPSAPRVLRGRGEIGDLMRDVFSRDLDHRLQNAVVGGGHVAFEDLCTYSDGTQVAGMAMADVVDGRMSRVTDIEAWDAVSTTSRADFAAPDETRTFGHGRLDVVNIDDSTIGLFRLEPGWKWSVDVKPIAGTDLCEVAHFVYFITGTMCIRFADGSEVEAGPGQVAQVPPGHDAWVVGDEPVTAIDWAGATHYAKTT